MANCICKTSNRTPQREQTRTTRWTHEKALAINSGKRFRLVELRGLEPLTSTLPVLRSPS